MAASVQYLLSGVGVIDPLWVRACLNLFREEQVNIRRLVLLQDTPSSSPPDASFSHLELQFTLSASAPLPPFLPLLERHVARQAWTRQKLALLKSK